MASNFMNCVARLAVAAVLGGFAGVMAPAMAADLGGNCCADLEERIAELEATTARKGNRKVSLEISGQVNEALLWWDDGFESNAGVYTNDNSRTRFRFKGKAKIDNDWSAGYLLEIGVRSANSKRFDQNNDNGVAAGDVGLDLRHSMWYIDSKTFGRVSVGLTGGAGESVTEMNVAQTGSVLKFSDVEDTALGLRLRVNGTNPGGGDTQWRNLIRGGGDQPGEGRRHNLIKYDTPELAGFKATVNWGEDDVWEVGLRYEGEVGDFEIEAGIAYGQQTDGTGQRGFQCVGNTPASDQDCEQLGGSISIMHTPTGLYGNFAAGFLKDNLIKSDTGLSAAERAAADDRSTFYAFEAGIEKEWFKLGKTTLFGQYYRNEGGTQDRTLTVPGVAADDIMSSELEMFGLGVVQGISAADMRLYLVYRHFESDATTGVGAAAVTTDFEDLDVVMSGAIIKF